jgi:Domain of unknown function (DUF4304)
MSKSALAVSLDTLQTHLNPLLRQAGFRKHGRTYNRTTIDGLTHVLGFQMGSFDPPGTMHIPGLRENLYGRFTVNLGVYVPEVARNHGAGEAKSVVHDYKCSIRTRLGRTENKELWWKISTSEPLLSEFQERLQNEALPFFQRFENRDQILSEFRTATHRTELMAVPRIVCAIILLNRGDRESARDLLAAQAREQTRNPGHSAYVIDLAKRLGVEITT